MGKADRISGGFWFIFSLFIGYESYKLGLGVLHEPGPGFLFFWTAVVIGVMSLVVIVRSVKQTGEEAKEQIFEMSHIPKVVLVLLSLFAYAVLVERIGFIPVTLLLFIFLLGFIEKKGWLFTIAVSITVTVFAYLVFETALQSQLPKGLLEYLRF